MNEDKMQILKMIENGTITAEDGMKLLNAVEGEEPKREESNEKKKGVRVVIYDISNNKKIDLTFPASIFKFFGVKYIREIDSEIDIPGIIEAIQSGQIGEIVNIVTDDGHRIIVSVE